MFDGGFRGASTSRSICSHPPKTGSVLHVLPKPHNPPSSQATVTVHSCSLIILHRSQATLHRPPPGHAPQTTTGHPPQTTTGHPPQTTTGHAPQTTTGHPPQTMTGQASLQRLQLTIRIYNSSRLSVSVCACLSASHTPFPSIQFSPTQSDSLPAPPPPSSPTPPRPNPHLTAALSSSYTFSLSKPSLWSMQTRKRSSSSV